jgi:hypothetical protein
MTGFSGPNKSLNARNSIITFHSVRGKIGLKVKGYLDILTDDKASTFHWVTQSYPVPLTIDPGRSNETRAGLL